MCICTLSVDLSSFLFLDENGILLSQELLFCKQGVLHGYHLSWGGNVNSFGIFINGYKHGAHWYAFSDDKDLTGVNGGSFLYKVNDSAMTALQGV